MPGIAPTRYAYLGPQGTFCETALRSLPAAETADRVPCVSVADALDAVRRGEVGAALVPLENSVEGSVAETLDELATGDPLHIVRDVVLPVTFALLARPGVELADIRSVTTMPHAEAQVRRWLRQHLPAARFIAASSTADGARAVAEGAADAAVAAPLAAEQYRLAVLADDIADRAGAVTRFVLVAPPGPPPSPTGADRTSLVAYIADDHPGALLEVLTELAVRGVNLTRIESRPTGVGLGRYCFSMDAEGHIAQARVAEALAALRRLCADVRFLGSYPAADGGQPLERRGTSDAEFADASAWVRQLRDGSAPA
ncbi:MAG TPA: prephenate dehydratase [Mycobacteriales bacterium]|jgi:prephenate dehydratase|nr:prephenate dehydratase [Mycobacteriales bacterium]